jgi:hypothetical protein
VKPDLEMQLRRDARAAEREVPAGFALELRDRLEREGAPEFSAENARARPILAAAAILVLAAALAWTVHALTQPQVGPERIARPGPARSIRAGTPAEIGVGTSSSLALSLPSQGMALAARAGEPLTREWQHMKSDSFAFVRELKRQLPPLALGE